MFTQLCICHYNSWSQVCEIVSFYIEVFFVFFVVLHHFQVLLLNCGPLAAYCCLSHTK